MNLLLTMLLVDSRLHLSLSISWLSNDSVDALAVCATRISASSMRDMKWLTSFTLTSWLQHGNLPASYSCFSRAESTVLLRNTIRLNATVQAKHAQLRYIESDDRQGKLPVSALLRNMQGPPMWRSFADDLTFEAPGPHELLLTTKSNSLCGYCADLSSTFRASRGFGSCRDDLSRIMVIEL